MSMMYCTTTIVELSAYTDGELTAEEESVLRRHIEECPVCRQMTGTLAALKETVTRSAELYPVPRTLRVAVQSRPQLPRRPPSSWRSFLRRGAEIARHLLSSLSRWNRRLSVL